MYYEKMYFYLNYLFSAYSNLLLLENGNKKKIIKNIKEYLKIFSENHTSYCPSLVNIFANNDNKLFAELFIQILGYYSQRGLEYLDKNKENLKYSKHIFEECLSIIKKYNIKEKVKNLDEFEKALKEIEKNCYESINLIKAQKIQKLYPKFSFCELIKSEDFQDIDEVIEILDKFKEASKFLGKPETKLEKELKAKYLANIMKIEYKIFKSNDYNALSSMLEKIEECIDLKLNVPKGCNTVGPWFQEICNYKLEIEEKIKEIEKNPQEKENKIKEQIKDKLERIEEEYNKIILKKSESDPTFYIYNDRMLDFIFFILSEHKPRGLKKEFNCNNKEELRIIYNLKKEKLMKELRKKYNTQRYKGDKEDERKEYYIMESISKKLNFIENNKNFID